jgi:hypothetical protein
MVVIGYTSPSHTSFHPRITQSLLNRCIGCSEDGIRRHLLSRHQFVCVRLRVPAERKSGVALPEVHTLPLNQSAGPFVDTCEPTLVILISYSFA